MVIDDEIDVSPLHVERGPPARSAKGRQRFAAWQAALHSGDVDYLVKDHQGWFRNLETAVC